MNKINFLKESLKNIRTSGTLFPSSRFLVSKLLKGVDFKTAKLIVEFGPGNGIITNNILNSLQPDAKLIIFEINDNFYNALLKIDDNRLVVVKQSADTVIEVIKAHNFENADYIISSLPLTNMPKTITTSILNNAYNCLKSKGCFFQYQYSLTYYSNLKETFKGKISLSFESLNIPPAFIYTCQKD
ncbi:MAG: methyltransferase [Lacinutrix sp.]|uniref:class I SAM-dependent methyltransferase n=1 Tax=Lacinutrix sp. TaxID=1937692 RepID=UPI0030AEBE37